MGWMQDLDVAQRDGRWLGDSARRNAPRAQWWVSRLVGVVLIALTDRAPNEQR
jgi:hypothetical protein